MAEDKEIAEPKAKPEARREPKAKKLPVPKAEAIREGEDCKDERCPRHGYLRTRGRIFEGKVIGTKTRKTAVVEIQYLRKVPKYERFEKRRSKLHVHIPDCYKVKDGDTIKFMECRKLSKTKAFVIVD